MAIFGANKKEIPQENLQAKNFLNELKQNKAHFYCVDYCIKDFEKELNTDDKVCLAKCSDNIHFYYSKNLQSLMKLKSFI